MPSGPSIITRFLADTSKLRSEVADVASSSGSKMASFAKTAAVAVGGAFAVAKVVDFGKAAVKAASEDAAAQQTLATTLKNVTGATDAQVAASESFITGLSKQAAIADDDLRPALSSLVRGFGDTEQAQRALALATDIAAGTGKDLSSVSEALMKAANGSTGALSKMGVEVKNADGSAKSLDQIMGDLSATFSGQAAAAADTTAGRMKNASIQFGEFQEQLGTAVLPAISSVAGILTSTLLPALQVVAAFVSDNPWIVVLVAGVLAVVGAVKAWTMAQAALNLVMDANPIMLVVLAVAALVAGIIWAYQNVGWFRDLVQTAFKAISTAFGWITDAGRAVFDWMKSNWPLLLAILTGPFGAAALVIIKNWDSIKDAVGAVYDWIAGKVAAIAGVIDAAVGAIRTAIGKVVDVLTAPVNAFIRGWNSIELKIPAINVDMPGPIPDINFGGQAFRMPHIPELARGAVLTSPTLFVGGDAGTEIVAPEDMLRAIVRDEAAGSYTLNVYPRTMSTADVAWGFRRLELLARGVP